MYAQTTNFNKYKYIFNICMFTDNIYRKMSIATIISDNFLKFVDFCREISKRRLE